MDRYRIPSRAQVDLSSRDTRDKSAFAGLKKDTSIEALLEATRRDKKARGGAARYALPSGLGSMPQGADVCALIDEATVGEVLRSMEPRS